MRPLVPSALRTLPPPLRAFTLSGVLLTLTCWTVALLATLLHGPLPLRWPLFPRGSHFYDLVVYRDRLPLLHTTAFFTAPGLPFSYFAPGLLLYRLFQPFGKVGSLAVYLLLSLFPIAAGALLVRKALHRAGLAAAPSTLFVNVALLTSFPLLFCLERGNLEVLLAIGVATGLLAFCTGRHALAAALWGLFGSVKLYPLVLLALFLRRGLVRFAALTLAVTFLTTLLALLYIGPTLPIAFAGIRQGTAAFLALYTLGTRAQPWDHSLFALLKMPLLAAGLPIARALALYLPVLATLTTLLWFFRIRHLPLPNQILLLSLAAVLLPPTSYAYTLTQLYGAVAALALSALAPVLPSPRALTLTMALLGASLCPFNLVAWHNQGVEGQETCLLLLAVFGLALIFPFSADAAPSA